MIMFIRVVKHCCSMNIEKVRERMRASLLGTEPKDIYAEWRERPRASKDHWALCVELTCAVAIKNGPNYKGTLALCVCVCVSTVWLGQWRKERAP